MSGCDGGGCDVSESDHCGRGCRIVEGNFGDDGRGVKRSNDEALRKRSGEGIARGFELPAAAAPGAADMPEDGDRGPEKRDESQNRDGDKNAHTPR